MDRLNTEYFNWLCSFIDYDIFINSKKYSKLITYLYHVPFGYLIDMDVNRLEDGINLKYRFGRESDYSNTMIARYLDTNETCSVLEMMVALSIRIEDQFIEDSDDGNQICRWFWTMIESLGLINMNDINYDEDYVQIIIENFLNRTYEPNGQGGLFTVHNTSQDMRTTEIWYQMCAYLNEIF